MCLQFAFFLPIALVYYRHLILLQNVGIYLIFKDFIVFFLPSFKTHCNLSIWSLTDGHLGIYIVHFFSYYKKCYLWWIFLHFILLNNCRIIYIEIILQSKILWNRIACSKYWCFYIKAKPTCIFVTFLFLVFSLRSVQNGCYVRGTEMDGFIIQSN